MLFCKGISSVYAVKQLIPTEMRQNFLGWICPLVRDNMQGKYALFQIAEHFINPQKRMRFKPTLFVVTIHEALHK